MNNCVIKNNSNLNIDNEIYSLVGFAKDRFGFQRPPTIFLNHDEPNSQKVLAKTGHYDPDKMEIHIYTTGRHPKDILRSIAHELVHHFQNEEGKFSNAGYSGKGYAQKNPHLRNMELQANDPMLFRDWEDSLKEKHPTIYNEWRSKNMSMKQWKNQELNRLLLEKFGIKQEAKPGAGYQEGEADYVLGMSALDALKDAGFDITTLERPMSRDGRALSYSAPHRNKQGKYQEFKKILTSVLKNDNRMKQVIDTLKQGEYKDQEHMISQFFFGDKYGTSPSDFDTEFLDPIVKPDQKEQLEAKQTLCEPHCATEEDKQELMEEKCPKCKQEPCVCPDKKEEIEEGSKPDFLDLDKDGDKKEPMKKAAKDAKKENNEEDQEDKKESTKEWKTRTLSENLSKKWGFSMNLDKLKN